MISSLDSKESLCRKPIREVIESIQLQKQKLVKIIGIWTPEGDSTGQNELVQEYMKEAERVVEILKQIDLLSADTDPDSSQVGDALVKTKFDLVQSIDRRIFALMGYETANKYDGPTLSDYLKHWKAQKYSEYLSRLTQYRIFKQRLVRSAAAEERNRMLERDMSDALMNYAARDYDLSELQFKEIQKYYSEYYPNMDGVQFYLCEGNYARSYFDAAYAGYIDLAKQYPNSKYLARSYWKMMLISYTYGWKGKFYSYFDKLCQIPSSLSSEELSNAYYLAGYVYSSDQNFKKARRAIEKISEDSKYYHPGQYLLGIIFVNLDNYSKAKKIFTKLADAENYPWTDLNSTMLRNDALIKLGYIHYQRGEFEKAVEIFNRVSKGYDKYDQSLIVQAWAKLKSGKYDESIDKVNVLFSNYVSSNYTYEALALSAHCKQILKKNDEAKKDLKYISDPKSVLDLSQKI